jgi:hypothetical protein
MLPPARRTGVRFPAAAVGKVTGVDMAKRLDWDPSMPDNTDDAYVDVERELAAAIARLAERRAV